MQSEPPDELPRRSRAPAWTLLFLAPAVGELLSGSSPPAEFFNPFTLLLLATLYGGGALLVREWTLAWHKGWPSLLVLGAAYAIVEEGLCCKSFFDPHWPDVGILGTYGHWLGVNWVWALHLTGYHAVISVLVPITLVELAFPDQRATSWVGPRMRWVLGLGLVVVVVVMGLLVFPDARRPFRPPPVGYVLAMLSVGLLVWVAMRLPAPAPDSLTQSPRRLFLLGLTAFLGTLGWFLVFWVLPHSPLPPGATMGLGLACAGVAVGLIFRLVGYPPDLAPRQRWALCTGALGFFILLAPIQEATNAQRPDNTTGMTAVGLVFLLGLLWLGHRLRCATLPPALVAPPRCA